MLSFIESCFVQCTAPELASSRYAWQPAARNTRSERRRQTAASDAALQRPSEPGDGETVQLNGGRPMERRRWLPHHYRAVPHAEEPGGAAGRELGHLPREWQGVRTRRLVGL